MINYYLIVADTPFTSKNATKTSSRNDLNIFLSPPSLLFFGDISGS